MDTPWHARKAPALLTGLSFAVLAFLILLLALIGGSKLRFSWIRRRAAATTAPIAGLAAGAVYKAIPAAERAWPGYKPLAQPLLVAFRYHGTVLLGAETPPTGFYRGEAGGRPFFYSPSPYPVSVSFNKSLQAFGSTVTAVRAAGGPVETATFFLHERFHAYQDEKFVRPVQSKYKVEDPADIALADVERRSLRAWLARGDADAMRDFAAARARRRRLFPASAAELGEERIEGTAFFVEMAAQEESLGMAGVRARLVRELQNNPGVMSMAKWRHYGTGAILCRWLDAEKVPGWRAAVEGGRAPSELIVERLALDDAEIARRIARLTSEPVYARKVLEEKDEIVRLVKYRKWLKDIYDGLPGRRLLLTKNAAKAHFGFEEPWTEYPDGSSILVASSWIVDLPEIQVRLRTEKCVFQRPGAEYNAEFAVPLDSVVLLDGAPWKFAPGRYPFRTISISSAPHVSLTASSGVLEDDGRRMKLTLDAEP